MFWHSRVYEQGSARTRTWSLNEPVMRRGSRSTKGGLPDAEAGASSACVLFLTPVFRPAGERIGRIRAEGGAARTALEFRLGFGERPVAGAAESASGEVAVGTGERLGRKHEDAEDDGGVFVREAGFDDEAAEHDFVAGIGFAFGHAEPGEAQFKPQEQAPEADEVARFVLPVIRRLACRETARPANAPAATISYSHRGRNADARHYS